MITIGTVFIAVSLFGHFLLPDYGDPYQTWKTWAAWGLLMVFIGVIVKLNQPRPRDTIVMLSGRPEPFNSVDTKR